MNVQPNKKRNCASSGSGSGLTGSATKQQKAAKEPFIYHIYGDVHEFQPCDQPREVIKSGVELDFNFWIDRSKRARITCQDISSDLIIGLLLNETTPSWLRNIGGEVNTICTVAVHSLDCLQLLSALNSGALPTLETFSSMPIRCVDAVSQAHQAKLQSFMGNSSSSSFTANSNMRTHEQWRYMEAESLNALMLYQAAVDVSLDELQGIRARAAFCNYRLCFRAETGTIAYSLYFQYDPSVSQAAVASLGQIATDKNSSKERVSVKTGDLMGRFRSNVNAEAGLYIFRSKPNKEGLLILLWHKANNQASRLQILQEIPIVNRRSSFSDEPVKSCLSFSLIVNDNVNSNEDLYLELESGISDSLQGEDEDAMSLLHPGVISKETTDLEYIKNISTMYTELPPKALESLCLSSSLQSMLGYPVYQESGWLDTSNRRSVRNTLTKKHERASSKTGSALMTSNKFGALGGSSDDDDASSGDCKDQGSDESHEFYHVIALDCEMCLTTTGPALTRVTLVCPQKGIVYDSLVLPPEEITDYLTSKSGITADHLIGIVTRLQDVQAVLARILKPDTLVIGHSMQGDLNALRLVHAKCIDTAVLFPHARGLPFKHSLRWLTLRHLKRHIQTGLVGHDSSEDAFAALELALLYAGSEVPLPLPWAGSRTPRRTLTSCLQTEEKYVSIRAFSTACLNNVLPWESFAFGYRTEAHSDLALSGRQYMDSESAVRSCTKYLQDVNNKGLAWVDIPFYDVGTLESQLEKLSSAVNKRGPETMLMILTQGNLCKLRQLLAIRQMVRWDRNNTSEGEASTSPAWTDEQERAIIREAAHVIAGAMFLKRGCNI